MGKIDLALLKERYEYRDGRLFHKQKRGNRAAGAEVGSKSAQGYLITKIDGAPLKVHRIIFAMHHGYFPETVDHINGDPGDNRIENLRAATQAENVINSFRHSPSGERGVKWRKDLGKWEAGVTLARKYTYLGVYQDKAQAAQVAREARKKLHGEFAHGQN